MGHIHPGYFLNKDCQTQASWDALQNSPVGAQAAPAEWHSPIRHLGLLMLRIRVGRHRLR